MRIVCERAVLSDGPLTLEPGGATGQLYPLLHWAAIEQMDRGSALQEKLKHRNTHSIRLKNDLPLSVSQHGTYDMLR